MSKNKTDIGSKHFVPVSLGIKCMSHWTRGLVEADVRDGLPGGVLSASA